MNIIAQLELQTKKRTVTMPFVGGLRPTRQCDDNDEVPCAFVPLC
jgi:hypothetical protein